MMEDKNAAMHSDGCVCSSEKTMAYKHKHHMLKFVVGAIFMFMAFWIGVQLGEIKGAVGAGHDFRSMRVQQQPQMMYGTYGTQGMMQQGMY
jgi:predicted phage tail protein